MQTDATKEISRLIQEGRPYQEVMHFVGTLSAPANMADGNAMVNALNERKSKSEQEHKQFLADATLLRNRMRAQTRGLLNPKGKFLQYWDFCTMFALVYTMLVTPYEVGLDIPTQLDSLMIANQVVAFIFLIDIFVQFFLPTPLRDNANYERRHAVLALNYLLSGWLFIDVITVIPWDILVWQGVLDGKTKSMKLLRILRLVKLVKVLSASRIIQRWDHTLGIPSSTKTLTAYGLAMLFVIHLFACGWCMIPVIVGSQRGDVGSAARLRLESAIQLRQASDFTCEGCFFGQVDVDDDLLISAHEQVIEPAMAATCLSPCLTTCERSVLAELNGWPESFVYMS